MPSFGPFRRAVAVTFLFSVAALASACGGSADTESGVRAVPVASAADLFENQPDDLVVLDVRTPDEFEAGHLEGAVLIDFYEADFQSRIAELDRDVPYLLYCRSGNRSGSTAEIMQDLGFANVADVEGGINSWVGAGHPVVG